ncbi:MAG: hypothetical protein GY865_17775 [candidate division Zixibacteria bacterium]|nr:hypothetical protein [candidate division Zixibacteria bacterium]
MCQINYLSKLLLLLIVLLSIACGNRNPATNDPGNSTPIEEIDPLDLTPRENAEAEEGALYISSEIVASQDLYEKVLDGFTRLREKFSDSISHVNIPFRLAFSPHGFSMGMSDSAVIAIRAGEYKVWDSLNSFYNCISLDTVSNLWGPFYVYIKYEGRLNTFIIAEMYEKLPGVIWASAGGSVGDWSCTYPWVDNMGNLTFLVRYAWGDCPSGCALSHYYYFKMQEGDIEYIGDWETTHSPTPPYWWDEAKVARDAYWSFATGGK